MHLIKRVLINACFHYVDVSKILIILYLTFISVGSLASSSLTVIYLTSKFFCFLYKRKLAIQKARADSDNFETFTIRNRLFNLEDNDVDEVTHFISEI